MVSIANPFVPRRHVAEGQEHLVPVYVWELPVRLSHWGIVAAVTVLTWTGLYMNHPFLIFPHKTAWTMGTVRFIHELAGFELIGALIVRSYWFFAGNHWARWRQFLPLTRRQWKSLKSMVRYYTFQQRKPFEQIGHNTLAGLTYLVVYCLVACECVTGLVLFQTVEGSKTLKFFVGWIPRLIDIQWIRLVHFLFMFFLMAFFIHHVYSAVLVAMTERNAEMESIFSGYKFVDDDTIDEELVIAAGERKHLFGKRKIHRTRDWDR
ncbi:MAG TPA: Ni/Fe-hydrogenase, b-type cytochrome subunit [Acidobacteriaceae bacterium]|jgi:Ni/Fe-hydrogenase 1 B-type cytochrome subunit|nr:Ni/Fe-hydrogenase, b-type cytochrome subunit [Acidobacteriaceae bacterium]